MKKVDFYFRVSDKNKKGIWATFKAIFSEFMASKGCHVQIGEIRHTKSDQQRAYAHLCIDIIAKSMGEDSEKLKRSIKYGLGLIEKELINGDIITIIRSTEDLNKQEYGVFIETILTMALNLDVTLPEPQNLGVRFASS